MSEPFNTLGGYSVGIPPELVIDANGNVVNNVNAPNSNVTANRVFANAYFYANGSPLSIGASGSNTQVQYNNNGLLGASSAFTFNSSTNVLAVTKLQVGSNANLGNVSNVVILGGTNGYFLQTDGAGNLTWAPAGNGGNTGNGVPGGANTQVQFNDAGVFGGDAGFTYNKVSNTLSVANTISSGNAITGVNLSVTDATIYSTLSVTNVLASNITLSANITNANWINASYFAGNGYNLFGLVGANVSGQVAFANVANNVAGANVSGQVGFANVANNVAGANVSGQVANALVAGTVYTSAQPNITSVGNLTSLTVVGNTTLGNQVVSNYFIGNLFGVANLARNVTLGAQPNITSLGTLTSLTVSGNTTLGNSVSANYFVGNLYGVANSALTANSANSANFATNATNANYSATALLAGTVSVNAQPNITSLGTLTSLNVNGISNLGSVGNVRIGGGTNGYVLTTDGTGNLSWGVGGNGNGTPGGSNTQIQYNDNGSFAGSTNFIWNNALNQLSVSGNVTITNTLNVSNISSNLANANTLAVTGNITAGNVNAGNLLTANFISGTLTTNSQQNINYLGNVGWLNVNTSVPNSNGNITFNGSMSGIGVGSNINITGNLNAGNYVQANLLIGTLTTPAQPNITSIGNLSSLTVVGQSNLGNIANITILGGNANYVLSTDGAGNLSWVAQANGGGGNGIPGGLDTQIQFNDAGEFGGDNTLTWNKVTNYMYLGGNANVAGTMNVLTTLNTANFTATGTANLSGTISLSNTTLLATRTLTVAGNLNTDGSANVNLGNVANIHISGGVNGYVLSTDGSGNLSWKNAGGGNGGGTPGGSNTQIQYNSQGTFAGSPFLTFNEVSNNVQIAGNLTANAITIGSGIYQFSYSNVYFATTSSVSPNQILLSIEADDGVSGGNVAGVDYTIISTDNNIRNFVKISCVRIGSSLNYVEYSTLPVNGYTGDFQVLYNAGNVISPATIQLVMSPQSANLMTHKMMVTAYYD
jgi:hypothetical protein